MKFNKTIQVFSLKSACSLLTLTPLVFSGQAIAATGHNHDHRTDVEEVVVQASPLNKSLSGNAGAISVLSGDELRKQAAASIGETLSNQVGVASGSFGPGVGQPIIRGQSASRVKVMQDNLDTMDAAASSADHSNATEALLADQVEVLRGPATLRFGSGAIGGVVNVVDGRIPREARKEVTGAVETRYSSFNDGTASVFRLDGGSDLSGGNNISWHIDGLYRSSDDLEITGLANEEEPDETTDGFVENTAARAKQLTAGATWFSEKGSLGLSISEMENIYGIPAGAHEHHDDHGHGGGHDEEEEQILIDMEQTRIDLRGELLNPFENFERLTVRIGHNDYTHAELEGDEVGTVFDSDAWEIRTELEYRNDNGWHSLLGLHWFDRDFQAEGGHEVFIPPSETNMIGAFWIADKHFDDWSMPTVIDWGLRIEQQSIDTDAADRDHDTVSLSVGFHTDVTAEQTLQVSLSRAQRAPTVEELFSDGPHIATGTYDRGDAELNEETSLNLDVGYLVALSDTSEVKVNLFYNQFDDFIFKRETDEPEIDELEVFEFAQEDASFRGIEVEWTQALNEQFGLRLFGDYVRATLDEAVEEGGSRDLPRITPMRIGAQLNVTLSDWDGWLRVTEVSDQDRPGDHEEETDGYTRVDAEVSRTFNMSQGDALVFIRANNLLNEEIRNATSYLREVAPEAKRGFTAGVRFEF